MNRTRKKSICMAKEAKASAAVLGNQGMLKEIKKALMQYKGN
jgi:hypothetical protein